jgi:hypothetical protein
MTWSNWRSGILLYALLVAALSSVLFPAHNDAQTRPTRKEAEGPWFGLTLPPPFGKTPDVIVGERAPRPVVLPAGDPSAPELSGAALRKDLETIVGFSKESRATKELGSSQIWGRVSGYPSSIKATNWAADEFRKAGIKDVKVQPITASANARFWMPLSWEVRLLADPAFGPGSADVVLESAMPRGSSDIPGGTMTAQLVDVGTASPAILEHIDVKGKIVVHRIVPQTYTLFEREEVTLRATELKRRGAIGVFNLLQMPGNMRSNDLGNCGNPCFNIGGQDSHFLEQVLARAAQSGAADKVRVQISLNGEARPNLQAQNVVATIPGKTSDEVIIVDAHVDGWFDGSSDNGDGFAVMMGLARHFAKPGNAPARTIVFIASAGHHSPGLNGPNAFVEANPDVVKKSVVVFNIEHVAARNFTWARTEGTDGYRQAIADSGEVTLYVGVSNRARFIDNLFAESGQRYGANFLSDRSNMGSGEMGGFSKPAAHAAQITLIQSFPLYHMTGDVLEMTSTPGMERVARSLAFVIKGIDKAARSNILPSQGPPFER